MSGFFQSPRELWFENDFVFSFQIYRDSELPWQRGQELAAGNGEAFEFVVFVQRHIFKVFGERTGVVFRREANERGKVAQFHDQRGRVFLVAFRHVDAQKVGLQDRG